ncbi:MAG TPA: hypothetical protein PLP58_18610, partial [Prosthecobacter sp.]|nr:hypothetical protein [Prosthecobacter sp.]
GGGAEQGGKEGALHAAIVRGARAASIRALCPQVSCRIGRRRTAQPLSSPQRRDDPVMIPFTLLAMSRTCAGEYSGLRRLVQAPMPGMARARVSSPSARSCALTSPGPQPKWLPPPGVSPDP